MSAPLDGLIDAIAEATARRVLAELRAAPASERPRVLDTRSAAAYLGRTPQAVREMARTGKLVQVRIDGRVFFDREDLDRMIDASKR